VCDGCSKILKVRWGILQNSFSAFGDSLLDNTSLFENFTSGVTNYPKLVLGTWRAFGMTYSCSKISPVG